MAQQTPKEKAMELVTSFFWELENDYISKRCAIIAVDEIIHNNNEINGHGDGWMYVEESTDFWQQVKQEINKL